jgi:hypothetical protein
MEKNNIITNRSKNETKCEILKVNVPDEEAV